MEFSFCKTNTLPGWSFIVMGVYCTPILVLHTIFTLYHDSRLDVLGGKVFHGKCATNSISDSIRHSDIVRDTSALPMTAVVPKTRYSNVKNQHHNNPDK